MASKTQIGNRALSKLGQPRVSNIDTTDTKAARTIAEMFDQVRDALLESYPWKFAIKRTSLAPDGTSPSWGWTYSYTPPSDFLSIYRIRYTPDYEFEGGKILTDEGATLYLQYISKITETGLFTPTFSEALASNLAVEAVEAITQSNTKKTLLERDFSTIIDNAFRTDAINNPIERLEEDAWVISRLGYRGGLKVD